MANYSVLSSQTPANLFSGGQVLGIKFTCDVPLLAVAARYYLPSASKAGLDGSTFQVGLWDATPTLLASGSRVQLAGDTGDAWVTVPFSAAASMTTGVTYTVAKTTSGNPYCYTLSGAASAIVNAPLRSIAGGGCNWPGNTLVFPANSPDNALYFADIVATDPTSPGTFFSFFGGV